MGEFNDYSAIARGFDSRSTTISTDG